MADGGAACEQDLVEARLLGRELIRERGDTELQHGRPGIVARRLSLGELRLGVVDLPVDVGDHCVDAVLSVLEILLKLQAPMIEIGLGVGLRGGSRRRWLRRCGGEGQGQIVDGALHGQVAGSDAVGRELLPRHSGDLRRCRHQLLTRHVDGGVRLLALQRQ